MTADAQRNAIKEMIARRTAADTKTKDSARAVLIREGVYTARGELRAEFGGKKSA